MQQDDWSEIPRTQWESAKGLPRRQTQEETPKDAARCILLAENPSLPKLFSSLESMLGQVQETRSNEQMWRGPLFTLTGRKQRRSGRGRR